MRRKSGEQKPPGLPELAREIHRRQAASDWRGDTGGCKAVDRAHDGGPVATEHRPVRNTVATALWRGGLVVGTLSILAASGVVQAQVSGSAIPGTSRTKAPLHDSLTTTYEIGGVRVIHRLTP